MPRALRRRWVSYREACARYGRDRLQAELIAGTLDAYKRVTGARIPRVHWLPHTARNRTVPADPATGRSRPTVEFGLIPCAADDPACTYPHGIGDLNGMAEMLQADLGALFPPPTRGETAVVMAQRTEEECRAFCAALSPDDPRTKKDIRALFPSLGVLAFRRAWSAAPAKFRAPGRRPRRSD